MSENNTEYRENGPSKWRGRMSENGKDSKKKARNTPRDKKKNRRSADICETHPLTA